MDLQGAMDFHGPTSLYLSETSSGGSDISDAASECSSEPASCSSSSASQSDINENMNEKDGFGRLTPRARVFEEARQLSIAKHGYIRLKYVAPYQGTQFALAGFDNGVRVFRELDPLEKLISSMRTETALGTRFLKDRVENLGPRPEGTKVITVENPRIINQYFEVKKSPRGGLGSFALKDLKFGDNILLEAPILRAVHFTLCQEVENLSPGKKEAFMSLYGYHPEPRASLLDRIWNANAFDTRKDNAIFEIASRFNHACYPRYNVKYHFDNRKNIMVMTVVEPVKKGEELLVTYGKQPFALREKYGFCCACGACAGVTEAAYLKALEGSRWA